MVTALQEKPNGPNGLGCQPQRGTEETAPVRLPHIILGTEEKQLWSETIFKWKTKKQWLSSREACQTCHPDDHDVKAPWHGVTRRAFHLHGPPSRDPQPSAVVRKRQMSRIWGTVFKTPGSHPQNCPGYQNQGKSEKPLQPRPAQRLVTQAM
jgi:hypothetical protein